MTLTIPAVNPYTFEDRAHADAVRYAHRSFRSEHGAILTAAVALDIAETQPSHEATSLYVRAFLSTTRALRLEEDDRFESSHKVYLERTYPLDTQYDRARRAGHNEACATAQHMAMVDTCTCKAVSRG